MIFFGGGGLKDTPAPLKIFQGLSPQAPSLPKPIYDNNDFKAIGLFQWLDFVQNYLFWN